MIRSYYEISTGGVDQRAILTNVAFDTALSFDTCKLSDRNLEGIVSPLKRGSLKGIHKKVSVSSLKNSIATGKTRRSGVYSLNSVIENSSTHQSQVGFFGAENFIPAPNPNLTASKEQRNRNIGLALSRHIGIGEALIFLNEREIASVDDFVSADFPLAMLPGVLAELTSLGMIEMRSGSFALSREGREIVAKILTFIAR